MKFPVYVSAYIREIMLPNVKIELSEAVSLIKRYENILILTHSLPDGDTLGCGYALCRALRALGKRTDVACSDELPKKYAYLWEGMERQDFEPQAIIAVDLADAALLGDSLSLYAGKIDLCIDHHPSNPLFAGATLLDPDAAAAAEIVCEVIQALDVPIDEAMANCLYTGISTDTGCFRFSNTTAKSHRIAAELIELGASYADINRIMFETKSASYLELQKLALDSLELHFDNLCAVISLTQEMFRVSGSNEVESEGIASLPRQIEGVMVGITLRERPGGQVRASVRTHAPLSAGDICKKLGGGGHPRAAGCRFDCQMEEAKALILPIVYEALEEAK